MKKLIWLFAALLLSCQQPSQHPDVMRGFNLSMYSPDTGELTLQDFKTMKEIGATLIRLDFSKNPLMSKTAPYNFNEDNFARLHKYIDWAEQTNLKVIIDPHTFPGTILPWTIMGHDKFWFDKMYYDLVVKLWDRISQECAHYGDVIWGYDLVNEPYGHDDKEGQVWKLNDLYKELVSTIRKVDQKHSIILMFKDKDFEGFAQPPEWYGDKAERLIYSPHYYWPQDYTHQGVELKDGDVVIFKKPTGLKYPNIFKRWTRGSIEKSMKKIKAFKEKHGVEIFFGEFSCAFDENACWDKNDPLRSEPQLGGDKWLKHLIGAFEKNGFHWTYHCYEDWEGWDATVPHPRWVLIQQLLQEGPLHPSARIDYPNDNQVFAPGDTITIKASAWDSDGTIASVEFFDNDIKIYETNTAPYTLHWTNAPKGYHRISVKATDNSGAALESRPVDITVQPELSLQWKNSDIGFTAAPGSAMETDDGFIIHAVEDDLYSDGDGFHAVLRPLEHSNQLSVRVDNQSGSHTKNRVGLIVMNSDTNFVKIALSGDSKIVVQTDSTTEIIRENISTPILFKLEKSNESIIAKWSTNGRYWRTVKSIDFKFTETTRWGLCASGADDVFVNKAHFSNLKIK